MNKPHILPETSKIFTGFPVALIKHLRQVMEAPSASDAFTCYCNLFEWLTTYLANLGNSVYKERPSEQVEERLEAHLRTASTPISFGTAVGGLRALAHSSLDFSAHMPELTAILTEQRLPPSCVKMVKAFQTVRKARETYEIPPNRLESFLSDVSDKALGKCSLDAFLSETVTYRNKGLGHQSEESWFPRDPRMYTLLVGYMAPALDDLLNWTPMRELLTHYEVVAFGAEVGAGGGARTYEVTRPNVAEGFAPLGSSYLVLGANHRPEGRYVARRGATGRELRAVVRYVHFPQTLQTSELLLRRYARHYLMAYLERGLITKIQRQRELDPLLRSMAIAVSDRQRVEGEIQQAINEYAPDEPAIRDASLQRLAGLLGPEWHQIQAQASELLTQLPRRRKEHIFDHIDNNAIMSFEQLRAESELSEPDLDSVLADLEQDGRVRQVGNPLDRIHAHFKAQDPQKPASFRAILDEFRARAPRGKKYPACTWRLIELCESLLGDDGIALNDGEVLGYRGLFEGDAPSNEASAHDDHDGVMLLCVGDEELRASSVRDLFEKMDALLQQRKIEPSPAIPFLIGRTRYLINDEPKHANGTAFAVPVRVGRHYYEANRTREQALVEAMAFLRGLGLSVSSPDVEARRELDEGPEELIESLDDGVSGTPLEIEISEPDDSRCWIKGPTVPRFFRALLTYLIHHEAALEDIIPVRAGRIRYLLADEPYHANGRPFDTYIEEGGYYMDTSCTYEQAIVEGARLCERLGFRVNISADIADEQGQVPLHIKIGDQAIAGKDVPSFLYASVLTLYEQGLLTEEDIPYKSGRLRYFLSDDPTHDHGRKFIRPREILLGGRLRFIEANISRQGALELIQRFLAGKRPSSAQVTEDT